MSIREYKSRTFRVLVFNIGGKYYDWSVKAGGLPTCRNPGEPARSPEVAESEAIEWAHRAIDELINRGHD